MKVIDILRQAENTLFSFEVLPPLKGTDINALFAGIDPLMEFKPSFINVTYHRQEYVYKKREKGYLEKVAVRKRPGTVGICAAIMNKYHVEAVPHLICGGFNKEETENALIDLHFLGIQNVLALRGDAMKNEPGFEAEENGHKYAVELVDQIMHMNNSKYLDDDLTNLSPTNFCVGVAGYPEKHFEAMNLNSDLKYLKKKVEAGAEYIVTQLFYDNQKYFDFVEKCRDIGIDVPIIPGIKPITTLKHIDFLPKTFHIDFPDELAEQLVKCKSNTDVMNLGVEWGIHQSKELIAAGVPCIHYYTMGKSEALKRIMQGTR